MYSPLIGAFMIKCFMGEDAVQQCLPIAEIVLNFGF